MGVETRIKQQKGSFGLCWKVVAAQEMLLAAVGAPGRWPGGALSFQRCICAAWGIQGLCFVHLVSKGAGHDLEFWKPGLSVCLVFSLLTPPEALLYTLDLHFQLRIRKSGDGMVFSCPLPSHREVFPHNNQEKWNRKSHQQGLASGTTVLLAGLI